MSRIYVSYNLEYLEIQKIELNFLIEDEWNRKEAVALIKIIQSVQRRVEATYEVRLEVNVYASDELTDQEVEVFKDKAFYTIDKRELKAMDYETSYHHVNAITTTLSNVIQKMLYR
mgnify:CR=1 FL=1